MHQIKSNRILLVKPLGFGFGTVFRHGSNRVWWCVVKVWVGGSVRVRSLDWFFPLFLIVESVESAADEPAGTSQKSEFEWQNF